MIKLLCLGKLKSSALKELVEDYASRIKNYHDIVIEELKDESLNTNDSTENIINREGQRVLSRIKDDEYVILLDLHGKQYSSEEIARKIENFFCYNSKLVFVIAASLGPSKELVARADERWQLSKLTFLHQMTRLILLEQIYRAFKIINNEKYHK